MEATRSRSDFSGTGRARSARSLSEIRGKSVFEAERLLPMIPRICSTMITKTVRSAARQPGHPVGKRRQARSIPRRSTSSPAGPTMGPMGNMKRMLPAPQGRALHVQAQGLPSDRHRLRRARRGKGK